MARASDRPIVVYNIPSRVVVNIEPETISRLAEIENVRAVKQAHDDLAQARHIVDAGLDLYAGDDNLLQPFLELGAVGGICVHTHVVGPQVAEQVRAVREGDLDRAREIDRELAPVYELLRVATNPIAIKAALNLLGHDVGGYRLPLVPPTDASSRRSAAASSDSGCSSPPKPPLKATPGRARGGRHFASPRPAAALPVLRCPHARSSRCSAFAVPPSKG